MVLTRRATAAETAPPVGAAATPARANDYVLGRQLGTPGKDKTVYEATLMGTNELVAVAVFHRNKGKSLSIEVDQQRRAAAVGLAPKVLHADPRKARLVLEILSGGTLVELVQKTGRLTLQQQQRIVALLTQLGAPVMEGGAALRHGDSGNPANYVADESGSLFLIDFAPPHVKPIGSLSPRANLDSISTLLWDPDKGLIRRGWLREAPDLLLRAYRLYRRDEVGVYDPRDPAPEHIPEVPQEFSKAMPRIRSPSTPRSTRSLATPVATAEPDRYPLDED